jgi:hypothetical protein
MSKIRLKDVKAKITDLDENQAKSVVCALVGHSRIIDSCFGYIYCARCGAQIGDNLCGVFSLDDNVIVGHDCDLCRKNYKNMDWRDKFMAPNPFEKE